MMDNKEIKKWLEKHGVTKEDFDKFNLSHEDIVKILTDDKAYIREKLGASENKLTETIRPIKINEDLVREIAKEIMNENKNN